MRARKADDITRVWAIEGEVYDAKTRSDIEATLFRRLAQRKVPIDMIDINPEGISFVTETPNMPAIREEVAGLNVALKIRSQCRSVALHVRRGASVAREAMMSALRALSAAGIHVYHCTRDGNTISLIVDRNDVPMVAATLRR